MPAICDRRFCTRAMRDPIATVVAEYGCAGAQFAAAPPADGRRTCVRRAFATSCRNQEAIAIWSVLFAFQTDKRLIDLLNSSHEMPPICSTVSAMFVVEAGDDAMHLASVSVRLRHRAVVDARVGMMGDIYLDQLL